MRGKATWVAAGLAAAAVIGASGQGWAQGSSVNSHSSCMSARGVAGIAAPCRDGSAVFYNPAALALQPSVVGAGVTAIWNERAFVFDTTGRRFESNPSTTPVPHAYASYRVNERLALGVGVFAPYGLTTEWPLEFEGRFVGYDNTLRGVYVQPTVAYQAIPGRLSVGAGADVVFGGVDIRQRLDLAEQPVPGLGVPFGALGVQPGTDFADVEVEGSATGFTGHVGLLAKLGERLSLGARYLFGVEIDIDDGDARFEQVPTGRTLFLPDPQNPMRIDTLPLDPVLAAQFGPGGPLQDQSVATTFDLPAQAVVGLAYTLRPGLRLLADWWWTNWSDFDFLELEFGVLPGDTLFLLYEDASAYRFGVDWTATDRLDVRGGFLYSESAQSDVSVSPLLPEAERRYYSIGLGYDLRPGVRADAFFQYIDQADRRGRVRSLERVEATPEEVNVGLYEAKGVLYGLTLSYTFGTSRSR